MGKRPPTDTDMYALADAMCMVLNDMADDGLCVCGYVKAKARIAFEPFRSDDDGDLMDLDAAKAILAEEESAYRR